MKHTRPRYRFANALMLLAHVVTAQSHPRMLAINRACSLRNPKANKPN